MTAASRRRAPYLGLALGAIVIGLVVHLRGTMLSPAMRDILGDALWGAMIVWLISAAALGTRPWARYGAAYGICALVEWSQAFHTPRLDAVRTTTIGHLILGSGFEPRDFLAYAIGVGAAALVDGSIGTRRRPHGPSS